MAFASAAVSHERPFAHRCVPRTRDPTRSLPIDGAVGMRLPLGLLTPSLRVPFPCGTCGSTLVSQSVVVKLSANEARFGADRFPYRVLPANHRVTDGARTRSLRSHNPSNGVAGGLHELAESSHLSRFLCSSLRSVAPYCVPGGVRSPWVTRRRVLCARWVSRKGDDLPATALVHARPSLARVLVSRCRARPRSPRSSPRLAGPYR